MCFIYIHVYYLIYEQNMATGTKCFKRKLIKNMLIPISTDGCFTLGIILVGIQRFHWFLGGKPLWGWLEETLINQRLMGLYKIVVFGFGDFWALFFSSNENGKEIGSIPWRLGEKYKLHWFLILYTHTWCVQFLGDDFGLTSITPL